MKQVYVLFVNPMPKYDDRVEFYGLFEAEDKATEYGFDFLRDNDFVQKEYKQYCHDCARVNEIPGTFFDYVTTDNTYMKVKLVPIQ